MLNIPVAIACGFERGSGTPYRNSQEIENDTLQTLDAFYNLNKPKNVPINVPMISKPYFPPIHFPI